MIAIIEGTLENPISIKKNNKIFNGIDQNKWDRAYKTVKNDMGIPENDDEFLEAVFELYYIDIREGDYFNN